MNEIHFSFLLKRLVLQSFAKRGGVAQLVEQRTENPCVASSILALTTTIFFQDCLSSDKEYCHPAGVLGSRYYRATILSSLRDLLCIVKKVCYERPKKDMLIEIANYYHCPSNDLLSSVRSGSMVESRNENIHSPRRGERFS